MFNNIQKYEIIKNQSIKAINTIEDNSEKKKKKKSNR